MNCRLRSAWAREDRVDFHDDGSNLAALPASWTSVAPKAPFREVAAERCLLRFIELIELLALARQIAERKVAAAVGPNVELFWRNN